MGLHHHVSVEATLGRAQTVPLILGRHSHVLEGHLGWNNRGLQVGLTVHVPDKEGASRVGYGRGGRQEGPQCSKMQ